MRSAWDDPNALFVGVKAGYNQVNHGHLDLGNFELDALGVRWARDLGSDDYNLPGYFDKKKGGKRWNYYRNISESHSVPLIDGKRQDETGKASVIGFDSNDAEARVSIDLTDAYRDRAKQVTRDVALTGLRKAVAVRDRYELTSHHDIVWVMTTDADIAILPDGAAALSLDGKKLIARVIEPKGVAFVMESAERPGPEKPNKGVRRLLLRVNDATGNTNISVMLAPVWDDGAVESIESKLLAN